MVHIVFGPNKVRRGSDSEWWIYGEEGSANALVFRFLHVEHLGDSEFYVLSRSIQFRSPWDRMVTIGATAASKRIDCRYLRVF